MPYREGVLALERLVGQAVLGQSEVIRQVLVALLADGHVLLESLPGLAKTRTVKALASHMAAEMRRIQFTPDLLPADITGAEVLQQDAGGGHRIQFQPGPLFGNLILADEINRAPAKVQSALLEAMEERQVTVGGVTRAMPALFMVLATQNPIEQEGTYPLPEAQMDRFLMKIRLDYPGADDEAAMLALLRGGPSAPAAERAPPLAQEDLFACRAEIGALHVAAAVDRYIVDLVNATRHPADEQLARWIQIGASPRGAIALDRAARAHAWLEGADFSSPDDVRAVAHPVLRHRLHLSYDAIADGVTEDQVIDRLLDVVAVPV
ncbi:AAA family ATPase [Bordetella hinzii]|uniref:AAA family ATPase n=1 Tax=Bordetella hinzii TaxID=103855 RepID=UPI00114E26D4|nr:MoxR family ATPase [Bordetella hinzii]QDJ34117.1 AAA family ATPase [Bordetella hinzii]QDJ52189.1 AAA family ATPase [Bordetella hinzii]QII85499.1 MoxR family ATPase [Bordetella hinzii]